MTSNFAAMASYWYEGICPTTGVRLRLPRTLESEVLAQALAAELEGDPNWPRDGKMYGVLLVQDEQGDRRVLRAFSGVIRGSAVVPGWVGPIPGREAFVQAEVATLVDLEQLKQELLQLMDLPLRQEYAEVLDECDRELAELDAQLQIRKQQRDRTRQSTISPQVLRDLQWQSRQDGGDRRRLRQQHRDRLEPLLQKVQAADARIRAIKQQRKALSQQLQLQMHQAYRLTNFLGASASLQALMPQGAPTGSGECCAPKLLHHAAMLGLRPVALAEFWWGEERGDSDREGPRQRRSRQFYGACASRCQPIMGFLLAGLQPQALDLTVLYEDDELVAVDKPSGLLSVPGRGGDRMDSAWTRLRQVYPQVEPVHRLDQDTSGVLLFAKDRAMQQQVHRLFEQRQVQKRYEALVVGTLVRDAGQIELPLWSDPTQRPRQVVDMQRGKPAVTEFRLLSQGDSHARVALYPHTGRTHQLRVHAAEGLGCPIVGDRLYGEALQSERLHLHACELQFTHPRQGKNVAIASPLPF